MKKILALVLSFTAFSAFAFTPEYEGIYDNYQVVYSPSTKRFSTGGMVDDRIVLTKKNSAGSGGYSEYSWNSGNGFLGLSSVFEFVQDGRLITNNRYNLTFSEVIYSKKTFTAKPLSIEDVQKLFPGVKIIKISDFKGHQYTLEKKPFKTVDVLLINDTNQDFYKYSFNPSTVQKTDIFGLLEVSNSGKITFSHFEDDSPTQPKYTIITKLKFF